MIANVKIVRSRPLSGGMSSAQTRTNASLPPPREPVVDRNVDEVMAQTHVAQVLINSIDREDRQFCFREGPPEAPCEAQDLVVTNGVVDFSQGHAVVLWDFGDNHRILHGRARVQLAASMADVHAIVCHIHSGSEYEAALLASRANLENAKPLTKAERRTAFLAEWRARREAGLEDLSLRGWAEIYRVSHQCIANWMAGVKFRQRTRTPGTSGDDQIDLVNETAGSPAAGASAAAKGRTSSKPVRTVDDVLDDLNAAELELNRDFADTPLTGEQRQRAHGIAARMWERCAGADPTRAAV